MSTSRFAVLVALVACASPAFAAEPWLEEIQRNDYLRRKNTGEGVTVVRRDNGVTQEPLASAYFEVFTNPSMTSTNIMPSSDHLAFAETIIACLVPQVGAWAGTGATRDDFIREMSSFVRYYVSQIVDVPMPDEYPIENGVRIHNCVREDSWDAMRHSVMSLWAWKITHEPADYPNVVRNTLQPVACGGPPLPLYDLAFIWFLRSPYGKVLRSYEFSTFGLDPLSETPEAIFACKTTPWIGATSAAFEYQGPPIWNEMGWNEYYTFGLTWVHTLLVKQWVYSTNWGVFLDGATPLGALWAAGDKYLDLYEGRTVTGIPESRLKSGGMLAVYFGLAMLDFVGVNNLGAGALDALKNLRKLARTASSPAEIMTVLGKIRRMARAAPAALGDNVAKLRSLFGSPLAELERWKAFRSGWRTFPEAASKLFGEGMRLFIEGGKTRDGAIVVGAQEYIVRAMKGNLSADAAFDEVRRSLEQAVNFSTRRAQNPDVTDSVLLQSFPPPYGHPINRPDTFRFFDVLEASGPHPIPAEQLDQYWNHVQQPGSFTHTRGAVTYRGRDSELWLGDHPYLTIRIWMFTPQSGQVEYLATQAARDAMWAQAKILFAEAVDPATSIERVLEIAIRIEHSMYHVPPYQQGSSTVAHAWRTALGGARGVSYGEVRSDFGFDLRGWIRTPEQFTAEFPTFFRRSDDVIDGVTWPIPPVTVPPPAPLVAPTTVLDGNLAVEGAIQIVASQTARSFVGWVAGAPEFADWETGVAPTDSQISALPPDLQNPIILDIKAFHMDLSGEPVDMDNPIAESAPVLDVPAGMTMTAFPAWKKPGFAIEVPWSVPEGSYGIWAVRPHSGQKKKLYPPEPCQADTTYHPDLTNCSSTGGNCKYALDLGSNPASTIWEVTLTGLDGAPECVALNGVYQLPLTWSETPTTGAAAGCKGYLWKTETATFKVGLLAQDLCGGGPTYLQFNKITGTNSDPYIAGWRSHGWGAADFTANDQDLQWPKREMCNFDCDYSNAVVHVRRAQ